MLKWTRFNIAYLLVATLGVIMAHEAWTTSRAVAVIPYSEFQQLLSAGKVKEVLVSADTIRGELKVEHNGRKRFATTRVEADLSRELEQHQVKFGAHAETVAFLKAPASHGRLGARAPKGILLVGPPGAGPRALSREVA